MLKLLGAAALLGAVYAQNSSLPEVDLGYEVYRAAGFNVRSSLILHVHNYNKALTHNRVQETSIISPTFGMPRLQ